MLDFINNNYGVITLTFSGVVAISTIVYAILTSSLVSETKKLRKIQSEPSLLIYLFPKPDIINLIELVIENVGNGPAINIKFEIDQDLKFMHKKLSDVNLIKEGLKYLPPKQKIAFVCADMAEEFNKKKNLEIKLNVEFENQNNVTFRENYVLDFSQFVGLLVFGRPYLFSIKESNEKIKTDIHKIVNAQPRMKVDIFSKDDRESEKRKMEDFIKHEQSKSKKKG